MPNPILAELDAQVTRMNGVAASAAVLIRGVAAKIEAAIAEALANGATAKELEPFTALEAALEAQTDDLAAAVAENP